MTDAAESALSQDAGVLLLSLGIVVGLVYYEISGLSPGGLVTPGVLAVIAVEEPLLIASVAASAGAAVGITRVLGRQLILYGRRELLAVMLVSALIQATVMIVLVELDPSQTHVAVLSVIVPGILAFRFMRQPWLPTLLLVISATAVVAFVLFAGVAAGMVPAGDAPGLTDDIGLKLALALILVIPGTVTAVRRRPAAGAGLS